MAAVIDAINAREKGHILTIEDPIEFVHQRKQCLISQREVGVHSPSFANALHSALREDPDAILVGELRDLETMSIAMTAAEMGVLVMGTLHTNGAAATIDRVVNIFPADKQDHVRNMLSTSLRGIVSQQLIKKKDGTGRCVALEILINTSAAANLIRQGKIEQLENVMQSSGREGMCTMDGSLKKLYDDGLITGEEAYLNAYDKAKFEHDQRRLTSPRMRGGIMSARQQRTLPIHVAEPPSLSVKRTILVTSALPYANNSLHLGHVVEYVQTDVWVRFQRLRGHRCLYVCASDAHGTPTMLRAEQEGIPPDVLVDRVTAEHARDFATYRISVDNYLTTHSPENEELTDRALSPARGRRVHRAQDDQAGVRREAADVPAGPLRQGHAALTAAPRINTATRARTVAQRTHRSTSRTRSRRSRARRRPCASPSICS